eukprot:6893190-Prorocentrum_lima.AAC.1
MLPLHREGFGHVGGTPAGPEAVRPEQAEGAAQRPENEDLRGWPAEVFDAGGEPVPFEDSEEVRKTAHVESPTRAMVEEHELQNHA